MSNLAQKTPFQRGMNEFARRKVLDGLQVVGKSLPCSIVSVDGWIVEVKFEVNAAPFTLPNVTVPVASSRYDYLPLQVGDPGVVRAADARLGGISGLGSGTANLSLPGNLSSLVFDPIGNKEYEAPSNPNVRVVQGPDGVTIQDLDSDTTIVLTKTNLKMTRDSTSIELDGTNVKITGTLYINGVKYLDHEHSGVQTGAGNTGPVV